MQASSVSDTDGTCPSPRTIAFAIAVVRSKPPELSIGEYVRLLREHIARGRREDAVSASNRHLDRTSYWRAECERVKDALKRAQDEAVGLKLAIEALKEKGDAVRPATSSKKRKKADEDVVPYPRSPKRPRRALSPSRDALLTPASSLNSQIQVEFNKAGESGNALLRSIFHVHAMLQRRDKTDWADLASHIALATSSIAQVVEQQVQEFVKRDSADMSALASTLTVSGRAVHFVLTAFAKLTRTLGDNIVVGRLIYAIVRMFKDILGQISKLSAFELSVRMAAELSTPLSKKTHSAKSTRKGKVSSSAIVKENPVLGMYSAFMARLIDMVDTKADGNQALFEGIAYCVLDKLGKRLYCTVFGQHRAPNLEQEILQSKDGDEIEDADEIPPQKVLELKQAKFEAPYLVHLLHRLMVAAPSHLGPALNKKSGKAKQVSGKSAIKATLAITAKECLQRTLVNSIFGTEGTNDSDPFLECLRMPVIEEKEFAMPKVEESDTQEWFKEEVWRLLGWDILEQELNISPTDSL